MDLNDCIPKRSNSHIYLSCLHANQVHSRIIVKLLTVQGPFTVITVKAETFVILVIVRDGIQVIVIVAGILLRRATSYSIVRYIVVLIIPAGGGTTYDLF
ncbi:uncharacterized protein BYT42DRAFT_565231 [Radiomyces spectabilis]|uniref:uncharacterized protein n=1 Tax=Radiomyces spectabilis TaxID=64574 RepID=UPI00222047E3|nr:uncharacterized protein BYT42DRAFT_565231 [Radiomyces spectabilis]KAI8381098.1 hypothetical protein BYT42DRAFT_565231 [Radiomyces spectabilis]